MQVRCCRGGGKVASLSQAELRLRLTLALALDPSSSHGGRIRMPFGTNKLPIRRESGLSPEFSDPTDIIDAARLACQSKQEQQQENLSVLANLCKNEARKHTARPLSFEQLRTGSSKHIKSLTYSPSSFRWLI